MQPSDQPEIPTSRGRALNAIVIAALTLPAPILALVYRFRSDTFAALTVWPAWAWAIPGFLIAPLLARRKRWRPSAAILFTWLLFVGCTAEEPYSLLRFNRLGSTEWMAAKRSGRGIRVVSLNCAAGSVEAMREVAALHPDIVLLQESPTEKEVRDFGRQLFGADAGIVVGFDASILSRGTLTAVPLSLSERITFVIAEVRLPECEPIEVASLRLTPACVRTDLLSRSAWIAHTENRQFRREQLRAAVTALAKPGIHRLTVLGGDFNAAQNDAVFDLLRPHLRDTFTVAGAGWGNTIINDIPVLRIDQIWTSPAIHPVAVKALKTTNSDHRMVIADLVLTPAR